MAVWPGWSPVGGAAPAAVWPRLPARTRAAELCAHPLFCASLALDRPEPECDRTALRMGDPVSPAAHALRAGAASGGMRPGGDLEPVDRPFNPSILRPFDPSTTPFDPSTSSGGTKLR